MKKTNISEQAIWDTSLTFPLRRDEKASFEVWDSDVSASQDRFLGSAKYDLLSFLNTNKKTSDVLEVPLTRPNSETTKKESAGVLYIRYSIGERPALPSTDSPPSRPPAATSSVKVKIHQARELMPIDAGKKMDPYVKITLGSTTKMTAVQRSANPKFDEEFNVPYTGEPVLL